MLKLGEHFVTFEACSNFLDIFFDNVNQRICTVRGNGEMGVTAKSFEKSDVISFRIRDKGKIKSLGFSIDSQIVSLQREDSSVDFVFLESKETTGDVLSEISQSCRVKGSILLGQQWVSDRQIVFITDQGCELYLINSKRRALKWLKSINSSIKWFLSYPVSQLILLSGGSMNSTITPILCQINTLNSLPKFEVEFGHSQSKPRLLESDVNIAEINGRICILVLHFGANESMIDRINVYEFNESDPFRQPILSNILKLTLQGLVGIHVVDNVVLVHHKNSQQTFLFDLSHTSSTDKSKQTDLSEVKPICSSTVQIAESLCKVFVPSTAAILSLYRPTWVFFAPNLLADLQYGIFTCVQLFPNEAMRLRLIRENNKLLNFLMNRRNAEKEFLEAFKLCVLNKSLTTAQICHIFHKILDNNKNSDNNQNSLTPNTSTKLHLISQSPPRRIEVDHNTVMRSVFDPLRENPDMDKSFLAYLVLEFFLTVKKKKIPMENHYLPELLVKVLSDAKQFSKLQQLLQYRVIDDSKFLAFELISLAQKYPPLQQMAVDMLYRRGNIDQIAEIFLQQGSVIDALRFLPDSSLDKISCHKVLDAAWRTNDRQIKYTVFYHLKKVKKLPFLEEDEFEKFNLDFNELFNKEEIEEAEKRHRLARISSIRGRRESMRGDSPSFETDQDNDRNSNPTEERGTKENDEQKIGDREKDDDSTTSKISL